jgi:DNA-binding response OmpR family regulator
MDTQQTILIVDDEPELVELYRAELAEAGFAVLTAANGKEGVDMAKAHRPDLILLDVKMDGGEAFTKLKEDPGTKDLRVVFLSAFGDSHATDIDPKYSKEVGAMDFIRKGLSLQDLVSKVKGYLKK